MLLGSILGFIGAVLGASSQSINQSIASGVFFGVAAGFQEMAYVRTELYFFFRYNDTDQLLSSFVFKRLSRTSTDSGPLVSWYFTQIESMNLKYRLLIVISIIKEVSMSQGRSHTSVL